LKKKRKSQFKLYMRKINIGEYKYEVFGGTPGGKFLSAIFKTKKDANRYKKLLEDFALKNPHLIQFRR